MDRLLSCECGQVHRVSRSQAGQEIKCGCGKILPVPTLRALSDLPLAESQPQFADSATTRGASSASGSWRGWRGTTLAFTMAGCLIASIFCGWFSLQRWLVDASYSPEQEIAAGEAMLDKFDPYTLVSVWQTFGEMGMRNKQYPPFYLAQLYAAERVQFALIAGGIALGFAAIGLLLWLTSKKPVIEN